jgi:hypothetical protein
MSDEIMAELKMLWVVHTWYGEEMRGGCAVNTVQAERLGKVLASWWRYLEIYLQTWN